HFLSRGTGEVGVDELDGHRTFAYGGGASFWRPGAGVARRGYAGDIGLEEVVRVRCRAGENEAVVGAAYRVVEPLSARKRAEKEEQERVRSRLPALEREALEVAVLAVERRCLAVVADGDTIAVELVNEVHC